MPITLSSTNVWQSTTAFPDVYGSRFRRVKLPDDSRRGLLGQGSILLVTSVATRTSPVARGKWVLENILGSSPPLPPPNVPALPEDASSAKVVSVREKMEAHRKNPVCASCHKIMDPIGFSLENFDLTGKWRTTDGGVPMDASSQMVDGTKLSGPASLRQALLSRSDVFVSTLTEKLMTYAVGRGLKYYDMPAVRAITREAGRNDDRFSSIVLGIVRSAPFQMKMKPVEKTGPEVQTRRVALTASRTGETSHELHHEKTSSPPDIPARSGRRDRPAAAGFDGPGADASGRTAANPRSRLGCIYVPHGATMDKWTPAQAGKGFEFTEILKPLEKYRDRLVVVSNLAHPQAAGVGSDAGADHARSAAVFLSGAHPEKESVHVGTTIDQIVAEKLGQDTPLPSMEVAIEENGLNCGAGYGCAYTNTISWKTPTLPLPMEHNPQVLFEKLFGEGSTAEERVARKQQSRSLLDSVTQRDRIPEQRTARFRPRANGRLPR